MRSWTCTSHHQGVNGSFMSSQSSGQLSSTSVASDTDSQSTGTVGQLPSAMTTPGMPGPPPAAAGSSLELQSSLQTAGLQSHQSQSGSRLASSPPGSSRSEDHTGGPDGSREDESERRRDRMEELIQRCLWILCIFLAQVIVNYQSGGFSCFNFL